ncbi:MAG: response regulator [Pseudomonadales bacterium]|nr:response regulator [Pseudomonadales bacterium]
MSKQGMSLNSDPGYLNEILIVEDTPGSLSLLTELIHGAGFIARQAQDGEMALFSVQCKCPDLILLDVRMPGIDGFEVCRRLKQDPKTAKVPVIFLSALQDTEVKVKGLQLGAVDYVSKPYEPEEVLQRVRTHLELRNLQSRLGEMCNQRTHQLQDEIVERKNAEAKLRESRQKLRELTGYLQDIREQERKSIAREIHDELGQSLTVARIDLTRLTSRLDEPTEKIKESIEGVISVVEEAANTARSISENLRPGMLDLLGLGPALEHHVARFKESTGISCSLHMSNRGEFNVADRVATTIFRILQEALTNVARHAKATLVDIQVADLGEEIVVIVQDDGVGISADKKNKRSSYGLLGMSERVALLGGHVSIDSEAGKGTRVEASVPKSDEASE